MAFVQQANSGGSYQTGTSFSITFPATVSSAGAVKGSVSWDDGITLTGIDDDKGNTYIPLDNVHDSGDGQQATSFVLGNITNGPQTLTFHFSSVIGFGWAHANEYGGILASSNPVDQHAARLSGAFVGTDGLVSAGVTTTVNGCTICCDVDDTAGNGSAPQNWSAGTGFTLRTNQGVGAFFNGMAAEDAVQSTAGAVTPTFTPSIAGTAAIVFTIALKPATGGTAYTLPGAAGAFAISGQAGALNKALKEANTAGAFVISGKAGALSAGRKLAGVGGAFVIGGQPAAELRGIKLPNTAGAFTINGQIVTLTLTTSGHFTLPADPGAFAISGKAGALAAARNLVGVGGIFTINGQTAAFVRGVKMPSPPGAFVINEQPAAFVRSVKMPNPAGAFVISGQPAALNRNAQLSGVAGAFVINGRSAAFAVALSMRGVGGAFVINGGPASLLYTPVGGNPVPSGWGPQVGLPGVLPGNGNPQAPGGGNPEVPPSR